MAPTSSSLHDAGYEACVKSLAKGKGRTTLRELLASIPPELNQGGCKVLDKTVSAQRQEFIDGWKEAWGVTH